MSLTDAKRALRKTMRARRAEAAAAAPEASDAACRRLVAALETAPAVASGYLPMRAEMNPRPAMAALAAAGVRLCLPVTHDNAPLSFRFWAEGDAMAEDSYGLPIPADERPATPDLLITPLLAFDRAGYRLGYGGGHYDRTLAKLRAERPTLAIGLAYAAQEVDAAPREPTDQRLDLIVTETETIRCG